MSEKLSYDSYSILGTTTSVLRKGCVVGPMDTDIEVTYTNIQDLRKIPVWWILLSTLLAPEMQPGTSG